MNKSIRIEKILGQEFKINTPLNYYGGAHSIDLNDERQEEWKKQREERGFDNTELWNFDVTVIRYLTPRLQVFKEISPHHPVCFNSLDEWKQTIDTIIKGFSNYILYSENEIQWDDWNDKEFKNSLDLFFKYFNNFWI